MQSILFVFIDVYPIIWVLGAHCGVFDTDVLPRSQLDFRDREHWVEVYAMQIGKKYSYFIF